MFSVSVFQGMAPFKPLSFTIYNDYFELCFKKILFKWYFLIPINLRKMRITCVYFFYLHSIFLCVYMGMCVLFSFPHNIES